MFIFICLNSVSIRYFLELGYAVIFLHRQQSLKPFTRQLSQDALLDSMNINDTADGSVDIVGEFPKLHATLIDNMTPSIASHCIAVQRCFDDWSL